MNTTQTSIVIYRNSPFIEDMGVLTTLCLLHDEVLLFGSKPLGDQLENYWAKTADGDQPESSKVVEQIFQTLEPEGVVSFLSPDHVARRFPGVGNIELPGIEGIDKISKDGKNTVVLKIDKEKTNILSRLLIRGTKTGQRTVSDLIRDVSLLSVAYRFNLPIISSSSHVSINPPNSLVPTVANYLAQQTLEK